MLWVFANSALTYFKIIKFYKIIYICKIYINQCCGMVYVKYLLFILIRFTGKIAGFSTNNDFNIINTIFLAHYIIVYLL